MTRSIAQWCWLPKLAGTASGDRLQRARKAQLECKGGGWPAKEEKEGKPVWSNGHRGPWAKDRERKRRTNVRERRTDADMYHAETNRSVRTEFRVTWRRTNRGETIAISSATRTLRGLATSAARAPKSLFKSPQFFMSLPLLLLLLSFSLSSRIFVLFRLVVWLRLRLVNVIVWTFPLNFWRAAVENWKCYWSLCEAFLYWLLPLFVLIMRNFFFFLVTFTKTVLLDDIKFNILAIICNWTVCERYNVADAR